MQGAAAANPVFRPDERPSRGNQEDWAQPTRLPAAPHHEEPQPDEGGGVGGHTERGGKPPAKARTATDHDSDEQPHADEHGSERLAIEVREVIGEHRAGNEYQDERPQQGRVRRRRSSTYMMSSPVLK